MRVIALSFVVCLFSFCPAGAQNHNLEVGKNLDIFNTLYSQLDLFYVDTLNPRQTMTAGIKGMLRSLDPYTEYFPEENKKDLEDIPDYVLAQFTIVQAEHIQQVLDTALARE